MLSDHILPGRRHDGEEVRPHLTGETPGHRDLVRGGARQLAPQRGAEKKPTTTVRSHGHVQGTMGRRQWSVNTDSPVASLGTFGRSMVSAASQNCRNRKLVIIEATAVGATSTVVVGGTTTWAFGHRRRNRRGGVDNRWSINVIGDRQQRSMIILVDAVRRRMRKHRWMERLQRRLPGAVIGAVLEHLVAANRSIERQQWTTRTWSMVAGNQRNGTTFGHR